MDIARSPNPSAAMVLQYVMMNGGWRGSRMTTCMKMRAEQDDPTMLNIEYDPILEPFHSVDTMERDDD